MPCRIETNGNEIIVIGTIALSDLRRLTATLHKLTARQGYEDVVLDLGRCIRAYPGPITGLCAQTLELRNRNIEVSLRLPTDQQVRRLFHNSNWAHLIDPDNYSKSQYRGYTNLPLARYTTPEEQSHVVDRFIDAVMCSIPELQRSDLAAIEWCLNEITDNVLVHSKSAVGGIVQMSSFKRHREVEFSVADPGIGIPTSLRGGHPELGEDLNALERAIREGVTRDVKFGQGNGLFGTFQVARGCHGQLFIHSGYAQLMYENDDLRLRREEVPYSGSLVVARLDCTDPEALGNALRFKDSQYIPLDYIDTHFEDRTSDGLVFSLNQEAQSFGSRIAGSPVRVKLANLIKMNPGRRVALDMSEVPIVSSSFADEVFGKLFVTLGPLLFGQALELRGMSPTVRALIDKAIYQRMALGPESAH